MNGMLFVFLSMASVAWAGSPCPEALEMRKEPCMPSAAETEYLKNLIRSADRDYQTYLTALAAEERLRGLILLEDRSDSKELRAWKKKLEVLETYGPRMRKEFQFAADQTALYYGVRPKVLHATVAGGALHRNGADWSISMQEEKDEVFQVRRGEGFAHLKYKDVEKEGNQRLQNQSVTMEDGSVLVSIRVFRAVLKANNGHGNPAILASRLELERERFEMLMCTDSPMICRLEGDKSRLQKEDIERVAVNSAARAARKMGLGDKETRKLEMREIELIGRRQTASDAGTRLTPAYSSSADLDSNLKGWADAQARLRLIRRQRERLNARLASRGGGQPAQGDDTRDALNDPPSQGSSGGCEGGGWWIEGVFVPAPPCPQVIKTPESSAPSAIAGPSSPPAVALPRTPPLVGVPFRESLRDLAERGCADPGAVSQTDYDRMWASVRGIHFPPGAAVELRLSGCAADLFGRLAAIAAADRALTREEFVATANSARFPPVAPPPNPSYPDPCVGGGTFNGVGTGCRP